MRYDHRLRARWSWERRKWAIDYPVRKDMMVPPVFYEKLSNGKYKEHLLPELSERRVTYQTGREPICYVNKIDKNAYCAVVEADMQRFKNSFLGFDKMVQENKKKIAQKKFLEKSDFMSSEGYERLKRDDSGPSFAGAYTKEELIATQDKMEEKFYNKLENL